ncbi:uncharacterized protein LOC109792419 [Cajanus cajan]|uniref:uncharacterized protein LOC109792419 n=1 Tax=Cajanus cajan TaxID=3821 RepID=UPI00098D9558|nr:uncharacterized protein LOC109792419 [Cajanus cajan]
MVVREEEKGRAVEFLGTMEEKLRQKCTLKFNMIQSIGRALQAHKLTSRCIGPYQILKGINEIAYQIALPHKLANLHNVFHVSQLQKYVHDPSHVLKSDDIQLKENLTYEIVILRIEDRKVKWLRGKDVPLVKVV